MYKGIPLVARDWVWSLLLDTEEVKAENPGEYKVQPPPPIPGQAMSGAQDSSWKEPQARVRGGGCGQMYILGTDGDSGTTGALGSADPPWLQKQGKKGAFCRRKPSSFPSRSADCGMTAVGGRGSFVCSEAASSSQPCPTGGEGEGQEILQDHPPHQARCQPHPAEPRDV